MDNNFTPLMDDQDQQRIDCLTISLFANALWKDRKVLCVLYGHSLVDEKVERLVYLHRQFKQSTKIAYTLELLREISLLPEIPCMIDLGELADAVYVDQILIKENLIAKIWQMPHIQQGSCRDVVLYGFGRIGRLLARELCSDLTLRMSMRLRAIVTRDPIDLNFLKKRASLLLKDSIHGIFEGSIEVDEMTNSLIINGLPVSFISAQSPKGISYLDYGIKDALLIDNTGKYRTDEELKQHIENDGISNVIVTAPATGIPNIVFGINDKEMYGSNQQIFSTASCTTNAISPVLDVIQSTYGIAKGHIETIHAYTNDQNLVDNMHAKSRRGRAAGLNMVITETGASKAVAKVLPVLQGKLTSNAIRVPVANGSLAILVLELERAISLEEVHLKLTFASSKRYRQQQIVVSTDDDLVSTDIIGHAAAGIVDSCASVLSQDGKTITLYVWYDNEFGYSKQVLGFANELCRHSQTLWNVNQLAVSDSNHFTDLILS